jgi:hypothetical protein
VAGLALGGVGLAFDTTRYWNCDNRFQPCTVQSFWFGVVLVAPWLLATVVLAWRRTINVFSCIVLAFALAVGFLAWYVVSAQLNLDHDYVGNNDVLETWYDVSPMLLVLVIVVAPATGVAGGLLQIVAIRRVMNVMNLAPRRAPDNVDEPAS